MPNKFIIRVSSAFCPVFLYVFSQFSRLLPVDKFEYRDPIRFLVYSKLTVSNTCVFREHCPVNVNDSRDVISLPTKSYTGRSSHGVSHESNLRSISHTKNIKNNCAVIVRQEPALV